jgi:ABC-type lipoprotein release transport system permease subunit
MLSLLSGTAGLILTGLLTSAVNSLPMPAMFSGLPIGWNTFFAAVLALGTVAILPSIPPAWRASLLTPVEARRYE